MSEERQKELMAELSAIAEELGWMIAIPGSANEAEDFKIGGLVIGNQDFLLEILGDSIESYDVLEIDTSKALERASKKDLH